MCGSPLGSSSNLRNRGVRPAQVSDVIQSLPLFGFDASGIVSDTLSIPLSIFAFHAAPRISEVS